MKKISIIVPVYNEENTIEKMVKTLLQMPFPNGIKAEVIVVNDASTDSTTELLNSLPTNKSLKIFNNKTNKGKTATVQKGILNSAGDIVVVQDADEEYYPYDLIRMSLHMINDPKIDAVYGNRFNKRNKNKGVNYLGNRFLTAVSNFFTLPQGVYVKDMEVCYKMIKGSIFREIAATFQSDRFGLEPETTAMLAKAKAKVINTDINYFPRTHSEGKKLNAFQDGFKALGQIIKFNLFSASYLQSLRKYKTQVAN
jgi:glycosyltransferase involved in cell wall biosynthesis